MEKSETLSTLASTTADDIRKFADLSLDPAKTEVYSQVDGLSLQNLYFAENHFFPNALLFTRESKSGDNYLDTEAIFTALGERIPEDVKMETLRYSTYNLDTKEETMGFSVTFKKWNLWARIERSISETYVLYGNQSREKANWLLEILEEFYIAPEEEKNNVFTLAQDQSGFSLKKSKVKNVADFDIDKQYNDDFKEIDEITRDFLEEEGKSGILIFHGEKGTGKTTYIRHLINKYPSLKFVTIPPQLLGILGQPAFASFLADRLHDSVIILEDCENAIADRKIVRNSNDVATLLNLGDGLQSDELGIKFICTFNEALTSIDSALMRKGRLAAEYDFKVLDAKKTKVLVDEVVAEKIEKIKEEITKIEATEPKDDDKKARLEKRLAKLESYPKYEGPGLSLADIYNIDDNTFLPEKKSIGF